MSRGQQTTKTILIVEDRADIGYALLHAILEETPYQAVLVANGLQALETIQRIEPSLFLISYQLPSLNGIELYDRLHATQGLESVPAIIMNAHLPELEIARRGITGMEKPLHLKHLFQTIQKLL